MAPSSKRETRASAALKPLAPKTPRSHATSGAMRATGRRSRRSRRSAGILREPGTLTGSLSSGHGNRTSP